MSTAGSGAIAVRPRKPETVDSVCQHSGDCIYSSPEISLLVVFIVVSVGLVAASIGYIQRACSLVEEERKRMRAEREAFASFSEEVKDIEAESVTVGSQPVANGGMHLQRRDGSATGPTAVEQVREAYRETVMGVSHYEEYGESLAKNMCEELGPEVTTALLEGEEFSPQVKQAVVQKAIEARSNRERTLELLAREGEALIEADDRLAEIEAECEEVSSDSALTWSFEELVDRWEQLEECEEECERMLEWRQEQIRTDHGVDRIDTHRWVDMDIVFGYVYRSLPVDFPVLSAVATRVEKTRASKSDITTAIARRI